MIAGLAVNPWALPLLFALVWGDAFLVVVPGEVAVTVLGSLAVSEGSPALWAVIAIAAAAAFAGDACCYLIGRALGLERWGWMRHRRARAAFDWARDKLHRRVATAVFTARFIPFARLAVNLTAGATRVRAGRYLLSVALAAGAWAAYQSLIGAAVAAIVPGGPFVAVIVAVIVAIALGFAVDTVAARFGPRRVELDPELPDDQLSGGPRSRR